MPVRLPLTQPEHRAHLPARHQQPERESRPACNQEHCDYADENGLAVGLRSELFMEGFLYLGSGWSD